MRLQARQALRHTARVLRPLRFVPLAASLALLSAQAQAPGDLRVALVIGNAAYPGKAALANPVNDAKAMAETLQRLGFTVVLLQDSGKAAMAEAIGKVQATLRGKQAIGMLYYAGHGLQLDWRNYMVPVDAQLRQAGDVAHQAVDLGSVIEAFKSAGNRMNIVVLDACRDNPFAASASGKGLAPLDAPPGTFLAYATAPGNVAEDGDAASGNGLYTQYLLQELGKPTAKIEDVFKRVRLQVRKQSQGRQIPWESTSLEDDFYFNTGQGASQKPPPKPDESAKVAAFKLQKAAWDRISASTNPEDFYTFLQAFPQGELSEAAQFQLDRLVKPLVKPMLGQGQDASLGWSGERFRLGDEYTVRITDAMTGVVQETRVQKVTAIRGNVAEINDGETAYTLMGAVIKNAFGSFDPPFGALPTELQVGKSWESRATNTSPFGVRDARGQFKVTGRQTITVGAGTYQTFVVEAVNYMSNGSTVRFKHWVDPRYGFAVRREEIARNVSSRIIRNDISELMAVKADRS